MRREKLWRVCALLCAVKLETLLNSNVNSHLANLSRAKFDSQNTNKFAISANRSKNARIFASLHFSRLVQFCDKIKFRIELKLLTAKTAQKSQLNANRSQKSAFLNSLLLCEFQLRVLLCFVSCFVVWMFGCFAGKGISLKSELCLFGLRARKVAICVSILPVRAQNAKLRNCANQTIESWTAIWAQKSPKSLPNAQQSKPQSDSKREQQRSKNDSFFVNTKICSSFRVVVNRIVALFSRLN